MPCFIDMDAVIALTVLAQMVCLEFDSVADSSTIIELVIKLHPPLGITKLGNMINAMGETPRASSQSTLIFSSIAVGCLGRC